uniref:EGF-like domain-containing protein n=1 Tax=Anolis carolinensis TaxID=28377 RepID=A0A803T2A3_ANOCA
MACLSMLSLFLDLYQISGDLCSPNPCPKGASCLAGEGTYLCSCPEGATCQKLQEACPDGPCQGE